MAYTEFEYYKNVYLCGLYALIGVEAFDFYVKEASRKIDAATDDRLHCVVFIDFYALCLIQH